MTATGQAASPTAKAPGPALDLYSEVSSVLTVRHLVTPLADLEGFQEDDASDSAADLLSQRGFDGAPVWRGKSLIGRVWQTDLERGGQVGDHVQPISQEFVISAGAPINHAMRWLLHDPWLLVVEGRGFIGIVTPADLNRHAVRTYFYLLLGELEIRLGDAAGRHLIDEEILAMIPEKRRGEINERLMDLRKGDIDSGIVAALNLTDLIRLGRESRTIQSEFGVQSTAQWTKLTKPIPTFRNDIMHVVRPMLDDRFGLDALIDRDERLRGLLAGA